MTSRTNSHINNIVESLRNNILTVYTDGFIDAETLILDIINTEFKHIPQYNEIVDKIIKICDENKKNEQSLVSLAALNLGNEELFAIQEGFMNAGDADGLTPFDEF